MRLEISRAGALAILAEASGKPDHEVCGLLLGRGMRVTHVLSCRNVADDPATAFEIDPAALIEVHRRARAGEPGLIGHYHSHPSGDSTPSPRDAAATGGNGAIWVIVGQGKLGYWRAIEGGPIHGAFESIDCDLLPDGCTKVVPSPERPNRFATYESHD